jgi:hypothetical protein
MKQFLLIALFALMAFTGQAQTLDFSVRGASGCFSTVLDTAANNSIDSVRTPLNPARNSVGFEVELIKISGNDIDSSVVEVYGTKVTGGVSGWVLLHTFTVANVATRQWFDTDKAGLNLRDNPYTGYKIVYNSTKILANTVAWRVHLLIR